jgi:hypothetical protein
VGSIRTAAESIFEKVPDNASPEKRELGACASECLRTALIMMAMKDYAGAQEAILRCGRASRLLALTFSHLRH